MSRLPCEAQRISYVEQEALPPYVIPPECAHPDCILEATDKHHIVRRSYTQGIGPQDWIAIDNQPVPNLVGFCRRHHADIEEGRASVIWKTDWGFSWLSNQGWDCWPLHPVPLVQGVPGSSLPGDAFSEREDNREEHSTTETHAFAGNTSRSKNLVSETNLPAPKVPHVYVEKGLTAGNLSGKCPTCKRRLPKPKEELEKPRVRVKWALHVPKDAQENGAEILDTLVEQAREQIGREEGTPPYYTLVEVLYAFTTSSVGAA